MHSASNLTIDWTRPELAGEQWEFNHHPAKQPFFLRHDITWDQIEAAFTAGQLTPYPRGSQIDGIAVAGSYHTYDDYCRYLAKAKRGYRLNYNRLEEALQRDGHLTLPAPIIIRCTTEALLFAGYRRLCLAWNYGMVPAVWLVTLPHRPA
jgi:hypothetical protein